jgi:hypothetical protein
MARYLRRVLNLSIETHAKERLFLSQKGTKGAAALFIMCVRIKL